MSILDFICVVKNVMCIVVDTFLWKPHVVGAFFQFKFEIVKLAVLNWLAVGIDWLGWLVQHQLQPANSGLPNRLIDFRAL